MKTGPDLDILAGQIARRINELRNAAGLTYEQLGDRLGITSDGVKKLISGTSTRNFAKLLRLASALGTTPHAILGVSSGRHYDDAYTLAVLEETFRRLGRTEFQAETLSRIILEVLQAPPIETGSVDPLTGARIQVELAFRQFPKPKLS
jgi:transcriptional regulator with XRE-family HTH domain